ncbi:uncharacterized protein BDW43DRAFT_115375 [Aspergillus alliaceus]|uniref:uncharacterized protein n=1 Tax=Petromyces alliaceus TaxID=209559 RepID=UPI0012A565DF|nr:uncharacterized protein BDW43DRAFT_115375 [Aspergillus alliaceus]KAB8238366.1 hypothetical protein BDW43DRAFT_115375 [Aspergillus alliaceus]
MNRGESELIDGSVRPNLTAIHIAPRIEPRRIASYCLLYWCVKTYKASAQNNRPKGELLDSWHGFTAVRRPDDSHSVYQNINLQVPFDPGLQSLNFSVGESSKDLSMWLQFKLATEGYSDCLLSENTRTSLDPVMHELKKPMMEYGYVGFF